MKYCKLNWHFHVQENKILEALREDSEFGGMRHQALGRPELSGLELGVGEAWWGQSDPATACHRGGRQGSLPPPGTWLPRGAEWLALSSFP